MQLRRAFLHGFLYVEHKGQFLVLYLQRAYALYGGNLIPRDDDGNVVAPVSYMGV